MSTISLKLQARPRTAPSTRDRKIGRLSRSDSQISLTSSIGTGRDSRTVWTVCPDQTRAKGPGISEKDQIVARSRHKTRIYRLHRIVRRVLIRRWVKKWYLWHLCRSAIPLRNQHCIILSRVYYWEGFGFRSRAESGLKWTVGTKGIKMDGRGKVVQNCMVIWIRVDRRSLAARDVDGPLFDWI